MFKRFSQIIKDYKELIWHLIVFDLKSNVARTYLGFLWWILDPLLYMLVFYFLVQVIFQKGGPDYAIFLFTALIPLKWTTSCLVDSVNSISSKGSIIKQIYVPKVVLVIVRLGINTIKFSIGMMVLFVFITISGITFNINLAFLLLVISIHGLFLLGAMLILSHFGVYLRDMKNMMQYLTRMLLYLSPVLFSIESVSTELKNFLYINPLTTLFVSYRNILMYGVAPQFLGLVSILGIASLLLIIGIGLVEKYDRKYVKVI